MIVTRMSQFFRSLAIFGIVTAITLTSLGQSNIPIFGKGNLVWVDRDGQENTLPIKARNFSS